MIISYPIMKDVLSALAQSYADVLTGNLTLEGDVLAVFNGMAPTDFTGSYVLVSADRGANQTPNKCNYMWDVNILLDCVIKNGNFGFEDSDSVREQAGQLINTRLNPDLSPNFQVISTTANPFNLQGLNPTEPVQRSLCRYIHSIAQLT